MKIFLYEHITAGGTLTEGSAAVSGSLLPEGRAIVEAVSADFAALDDVEVILLTAREAGIQSPDCRVVEPRGPADVLRLFDTLAAECDWTLVIAPELQGVLLDRCRRVEQCGGRLLGPSLACVEAASDKHALAEHLARCAGVGKSHATSGIALRPGESLPADFDYPAILKPRDGAGSHGVQLVATPGIASQIRPAWEARLERFIPGIAASVAVLCGPEQICPLPACQQHLSDDGRFEYLGGSLPLESGLAKRAARLASWAVAALPRPQGYIGVDLVLSRDNPPEDVVIEVNPRLTTSYVGLRAACRDNLAAAMLAIAEGHAASLSFRDEALQFDPSGHVRVLREAICEAIQDKA